MPAPQRLRDHPPYGVAHGGEAFDVEHVGQRGDIINAACRRNREPRSGIPSPWPRRSGATMRNCRPLLENPEPAQLGGHRHAVQQDERLRMRWAGTLPHGNSAPSREIH